MLRIAPRLMIALLCGQVLAGCATTSAGIAKLTGNTPASPAKKETAAAADKSPVDLDSSLRQAQLQRIFPSCSEAGRSCCARRVAFLCRKNVSF